MRVWKWDIIEFMMRSAEKMTKTSARLVALASLRRGLKEATGIDAGEEAQPTCDEFRVIAGRQGKAIATDLGRFWDLAKSVSDGPVDVIDMFSGCGGMSAGFKSVNGLVPAFRLLDAVDIDGVANKSYEINLGLHPTQEDVSALAADKKRLLAWIKRKGRRDSVPLVMIGCAPCQGFSSHRNSAGRGDGRNTLFLDFARIAATLLPDFVVVENVPELLTDGYWPYVEEARSILEAKGYKTHLSVHNMAAFGVPQERFRALMLASRRSFAPIRGFFDRSQFRTVRDAIGGLTPFEAGQRDPADAMHYSAGHKESTIATIRAVPKDGGNRPADVGPDCLRRIAGRQGRSAYDDVYGRLYWDRPAITITAHARNPASGRFVHPEQDRALSIREAALLQSFPSDYWFAGTLDERFRQIGNAVPPAFSAFLAMHILGELTSPRPPRIVPGPGLTRPIGTSFSRVIPALKAGHRSMDGATL